MERENAGVVQGTTVLDSLVEVAQDVMKNEGHTNSIEQFEGGGDGDKEEKEMCGNKEEKEMCGICLSREVLLQGKLDCCEHLFCFTCILDWSEIESRCPLCKQRFSTIAKPTLLGVSNSLEEMIEIPETNQKCEEPSEEAVVEVVEVVGWCNYCWDWISEASSHLTCSFCLHEMAHLRCIDEYEEVSLLWRCTGCQDLLSNDKHEDEDEDDEDLFSNDKHEDEDEDDEDLFDDWMFDEWMDLQSILDSSEGARRAREVLRQRFNLDPF